LRFLIDAQLPPALAERLIELGHEAQHVYRLGLKGVQDLLVCLPPLLIVGGAVDHHRDTITCRRKS
jgi:hypothetical protein